MSDKLIKYDYLAAAVQAASTAATFAGQKAALADQKAGLADQKAALAQQKADLAQSRADTAGQAQQAATSAASAAQQAANSANSAAGQATTQANYAQARGDYAQQQAEFARQQAEIAQSASSRIGDMSRAVYDTNSSGVVDDTERLGGVPASGYVRSGTDPWRLAALSKLSAYPADLSTAQGHVRFRLGSLTENGSAPLADVLDLSTAASAASGGVNALYFRKDQARLVHKYGAWAGGAWASEREIAYRDEIVSVGTAVKLDGSTPLTGTLQLSAGGVRFPDNLFGGVGDLARLFVQRVDGAASGENAELVIEVGNDAPLDRINLRALRSDGTPDYNAVTVAGQPIWNAGNFNPSSKVDATNPSATGPFTLAGALTLSGGLTLRADAALGVLSTAGARSLALLPGSGRVGVGTSTPGTALDVLGETRSESVTALTRLTLPGPTSSYLAGGTGDGASFTTYNLAFRSWWGVGFRDHTDTVNAVLDTRAGSWLLKGGLTLSDGAASVALTRTGLGLRVSNTNGSLDVTPTTGALALLTDRSAFDFNRALHVAADHLSLWSDAFTAEVTRIGRTTGHIGGKGIILEGDARLKAWGNWATNGGNDLLVNNKRALVGVEGDLYLNYAGDHTQGVTVMGPRLTVQGELKAASLISESGGATLRGGADLVFQSAAGSQDTGDVVFRAGNTELGRVYTVSGSGLRLSVQGADRLSLSATEASFLTRVISTAPSGALSASLYTRAHLRAETTDGSAPAVGFHRVGAHATALYLGSDERLRTRNSSDQDALILTTLDVEAAQVTGIRSTLIAGGDLDAPRPSGVYIGDRTGGAPDASWYYTWNAAHNNPDFRGQLSLNYFGDALRFRRRDEQGWKPWRTLWHDGHFDPGQFLTLDGSRRMGATLVLAGSNPAVFAGDGRRWLWHRPNNDTLILAPAATPGQDDWDWPRQLSLHAPSGTLTVPRVASDTVTLDARGVERQVSFVNREGASIYLYAAPDNGGRFGLFDSAQGAVFTYHRNGNQVEFGKVITAPDFLKLSSRALKRDIRPYEQRALDEIDRLRIVRYRYKASEGEHVGIIADDTENTLIAGERRDAFNTANALAIALRAIQELRAELRALRAG